MGTAKFGFDDDNGKKYDPVTLAPPHQIPCSECGGTMICRSHKTLNPLIWCYVCSCKADVEIQETQTIEHWPEDVRKRHEEGLKRWAAAGHPMTETIGTVIRNISGVSKLEIDE